MTTRGKILALAGSSCALAVGLLGAAVVVPTPVAILLAVTGASFLGFSAVGAVAAAAAKKGRVRDYLASLLSDPVLVARLVPPRVELRRRIQELIRVYHGEAGLGGDEIVDAVEGDILARLDSPLRRDYDISVDLSVIAPGVVRILREVSYVVCRLPGADTRVFGSGLVYGATVEVKPEMRAAGFGEGDVARFVVMAADGLPLAEGTDYTVKVAPGDERVRIEVHSDKIFPASHDRIRITYTTETLASTSDYMTFTMMTLVYSASLVVRYDPAALSVQLLALVPVDWPIARVGSEARKGTKVIDLNGKVLVPGHSLLASWTPTSGSRG